jgi:hypothetical protein
MELSDTMHGNPMQTAEPNGVRSSDWLAIYTLGIGGGVGREILRSKARNIKYNPYEFTRPLMHIIIVPGIID